MALFDWTITTAQVQCAPQITSACRVYATTQGQEGWRQLIEEYFVLPDSDSARVEEDSSDDSETDDNPDKGELNVLMDVLSSFCYTLA